MKGKTVLRVSVALVAGLIWMAIVILWMPPLTRHAVTPAPEGPVVSDDNKPVCLAAVGDIMLTRRVDGLCQRYGYDYPVREMAADLQVSDITFGNLECAVANTGRPLPGKGICFRADPRTLLSLTEAGFDIVSVANNHSMDYDETAFIDTLQHLQDNGIKAVGGGKDLETSRRPVIMVRNGVRIAFLAYSDMADLYFSSTYPREFRADVGTPGVAPLHRTMMLDDIANARKEANVVVVSLHWGVEYSRRPTAEQKQLAHDLIDAGASLIIGHHSHVFQGLEKYHSGVIAYSLGNFIFDQDQSLATRQGLVLAAFIDRKGLKEVRVRPVFIEDSQPTWCQGKGNQDLLEEIAGYCRELGTASTISDPYLKISL